MRRRLNIWRRHWVLWRLGFVALAGLLLLAEGLWQSRGLDCTYPVLRVKDLPKGLEGLRVAQITDLHSSWFGPGQEGLISPIRGFKPDAILLTGDIVDGVRPDFEPCVELVRQLAQIAPVYRVSGNHEYYLDPEMRRDFDDAMAGAGAVLLENNALKLERHGTPWLLAGMDDSERRLLGWGERWADWAAQDYAVASDFFAETQANVPPGDYGLRVMLCHRPYYWQLWSDGSYDAAFCGHLHGWVVRLPFLGGIAYQPNRFFPSADSGLYRQGNTEVYISRGLAKTGINRLRLFNRPELTLAEFRRAN